jgi:lipoprotein
MMKILTKVIFSLLILAGCSKSNKVEFSLSHVQPETSFSLPPIEQCDSFSIVPPYLNMDSLHNVEIPDNIRDVCEEMLVNDGVTTLLFYHKDSVVAYATMQRSIADFASFDVSKKYSIGQQLFLNKERKVIVNH